MFANMPNYKIKCVAAVFFLSVAVGCSSQEARNDTHNDAQKEILISSEYLSKNKPTLPLKYRTISEQNFPLGVLYVLLRGDTFIYPAFKLPEGEMEYLARFVEYFCNRKADSYSQMDLCLILRALDRSMNLHKDDGLNQKTLSVIESLSKRTDNNFWLRRIFNRDLDRIKTGAENELVVFIANLKFSNKNGVYSTDFLYKCAILAYIHSEYVGADKLPPRQVLAFARFWKDELFEGRIVATDDNYFIWYFIIAYAGYDTFGPIMGYLSPNLRKPIFESLYHNKPAKKCCQSEDKKAEKDGGK